MQPVEAYKMLKEHLTNQDYLIRQKVVGLFISNSVLLVAFFTSKGDFAVFRIVLAAIALFLCIGFTLSLAGDIKARWRCANGLARIEQKRDFAYLKRLKKRPITDIEHGVRGQVTYKWLVHTDIFWPILPAFFVALWALALKGI